MAQKKKSTSFNRLPGVFRTVQRWAQETHGPGMNHGALRILSFGCSDGLEVATLRCYFPSACIFGCDVHSSALALGRTTRSGIFFHSNEENIRKAAPFDIVVASSVLCRHPLKSTIAAEFPFKEFASLVEHIDDCLRPGGLFVLHNASYLFSDLLLSENYRPVRSPLVASSGWVPKWTPQGDRIGPVDEEGRTLIREQATDDNLLSDCLFEKSCGDPLIFKEGTSPPADLRSIKSRSLAENSDLLVEELFTSADGSFWMRRQWQASGVDEMAQSNGAWWEPASPEMIEVGSPSILCLRRARTNENNKHRDALVEEMQAQIKLLHEKLRVSRNDARRASLKYKTTHARQQKRIQSLQSSLTNLRKSTSWRLTKPLRATGRALKSLKVWNNFYVGGRVRPDHSNSTKEKR